MATPQPGETEIVTEAKILQALARIPCANCGKHCLRLEIRYGQFKVSPVGTFSLAGGQMKFTATMEAQGVLVCDTGKGGCGWEKVESID